MTEKALYLLAKFDNQTQNVLGDYYDALYQNGFVGSQTKNIPYHFTLGSRSVDIENETMAELEKVCAGTPCFDINLAHIGLFGLDVLFISPAMNFELLKLQQAFFPGCGNGCHPWITKQAQRQFRYPWAAHATLLIDEPETIQKAIPIVAGNFKPFNARIESVLLYEFFPARFIGEYKLINQEVNNV